VAASGPPGTTAEPGIIRKWLQHLTKSVAVVLVAQEWPYWLASALVLGLDLAAVLIAARFWPLFLPFVESSDGVPWHDLDAWHAMPFWPADWYGHAVLILGSAWFLESMLSKLSDHVGPLIFSLDTVFAGHWLQDVLSAV
jgi:hypothetical protein